MTYRPATKLLTVLANRLPTSYSTAWADTAGWVGSTLSVDGAGNASIAPTAGAELLANPGFEAPYTSGVANGWIKNGTFTPTQDTTDPHSGTSDQQVTGSTISNVVSQIIAATTGSWYQGSAYGKYLSGTGEAMLFWLLPNVVSSTVNAYTQLLSVGRAPSASPIFSVGCTTISTVSRFDDASVKPLTTSTTYAYRNMGYSTGSISVPLTRQANTPAGLILYKDASNFLILYHNGQANLLLDQCVGGTYTGISSVAMTYSAGATMKLSIPGGNVASGIYNGSTLINGATINATFASATRWGIFSAYSGNTFGALSWSVTP